MKLMLSLFLKKIVIIATMHASFGEECFRSQNTSTVFCSVFVCQTEVKNKKIALDINYLIL